MNKGLSLWLDVLRVMATFVVVFSHFAYPRFSNGAFQWFRDLNLGSDAVVIFFEVSGLVIAFAADRDAAAGEYAFNRLTRLWSVLIPALVLTFLLDSFGARLDPNAYPEGFYAPVTLAEMLGRGAIFTNEFSSLGLLRLGTNGPLWSLRSEAAYYAIFGVAVFSQGAKRVVLLLGLAYLIGVPILLLMPAWLMGVAAWYGLKSGRFEALSHPRALICAVGAPLAYTLLLWADAPQILSQDSSAMLGGINLNASFGFSDEFVWNGFLGLLTVTHIIGMSRLTAHARADAKAIRWLAGGSFSLYVTHYPLLHFFDAALPDSAGRAALMLAGTLIAGLLFAAIFERPIKGVRQILRRAITAFNPPNAKAFDSTTSTAASRATLGTTSSAHSGSGSS